MRDYNDPAYKIARSKVLKRDKKTCQMPGCGCKRKLQVHHVEPWSKASSLRYETYNLITLCKKCHEEVTGHESCYVSLFMDIVRKNEK